MHIRGSRFRGWGPEAGPCGSYVHWVCLLAAEKLGLHSFHWPLSGRIGDIL